MFRLTLLLAAVMFTTLLVAGRDRGQMRPGIANALAQGEEIVPVKRSFSPVVTSATSPEPERLTALDLPPPIELVEAPKIGSVPKDEGLQPEPSATPIFTLSALPGLGGEQASLDDIALGGAEAEQPEVNAGDNTASQASLGQDATAGGSSALASSGSLYADPSDGGALSAEIFSPPADSGLMGDGFSGGEPDLRVVQASSANVRLGPSTDSEVVGKLFGGEVVQVIGASDSDWVEVSVEGDGIHGYVASRLLLSVGY